MSILPGRYRLENVGRALRNPELLLGEVDQVGAALNVRLHERLRERSDLRVMDEDWDNLLILDGCRYDAYESRTSVDGDLEPRSSGASESWEFMRTHFAGRDLHDTVYVTANPHAYKLEPGTFHHVDNLLDDRWDPELQTVRPEPVAEATLAAHERFPDKRLIAHFMQPHFPFIGESGRAISHGGITYHRGDDEPKGEMLIWGLLQRRLVDRERVWEAYVENLDLVLEVVADLLTALPGKTVVTADHGNLFGERLRPIPVRGYGHPPGLHAPNLRRVPWHVVPGETRRTIRSERPVDRETLDDDVAQRRLRELGYAE